MDVSVLKKSSLCYLEMEAHKKPQSGFQLVLADNSYNQFKHLMLPLEAGGDCEYVHPYKEEIDKLLENLETDFLCLFDGEVTRIEDTDYVWVETASQLEELAEVLSKERVFGVDTEQDSFRSFLGFTALIQISTTSKDYLVDAIALHDVMGILHPVFANPHICKVFHGAGGSDILWLQRDFHIYVVNLFDTAKACEVLWKEPKSFAFLLEKYCNVSKNKALQRADWTPRPLSAEMVEYARTDSHYLLPVANCLVLELRRNSIDLVLDTIRRSNVICLKLYEKGTEEAYLGEFAAQSIISRYLSNQGSFHYKVCDTELCSWSCFLKFQRIVRRLCGWREIMARVHDESLSFILSNQAIGAIAATLTTTETDVHGTICTADDSRSPSLVDCSHFDDFGILMFPDSATEDDDLGHTILQWHLGSIGNCPLSLCNINLLSNAIPKLSNRPILNPNGDRKKSMERSVEVSLCKYPVYDNCRVMANDGQFLRYCSRRLIKWYLDRDLAKLVEDDPLAIMLFHEFKGSFEDKCREYKKNACVGCDEENNYSRYRIIPQCYSRWFPVHLKNNCSKEKVNLCMDCYAIVNAAAMECKRQIAQEFGTPLPQQCTHLRQAAAALLLGSKMSPNYLEEMKKRVSMYYGGREVTVEDLQQAVLVGLVPRTRNKKRLQFQHPTVQALAALQKIGISHSNQQKRSKEDEADDDDDDDVSATSGNPKDQVKNSASSSDFGTSEIKSKGWLDHGKQVVDSLLRKNGEDGILEFCQRWRQVLTNALHLA